MTFIQTSRRLSAVVALAGAALLAGCASLHAVSSSVTAYGSWPADLPPGGTYTFDRLPSQEANLKRQQLLETAASHALDGAGLRPAADGARPTVTVQVGARIERFEVSPWDDPLWLSGRRHGVGYPGVYGPSGFYGPYGPYGPYWGAWPAQPDQYLREVAVLIRDGATGKPLYETRASNDGYNEGSDRVLGAMFDAAMAEFPRANATPHEVTVPLQPVVRPAMQHVVQPAKAASAP